MAVQRPIWLSGVAAVALTGIVAAEVACLPGGAADAATASASRPAEPPPAAAKPPKDGADKGSRRALAILERPLFSPGRRPAQQPGQPAAASEPLPRLAGTFVSPAGRRAVFATADKPTALDEGGRIGPWTVQAIKAGEVTLAGPGGVQTMSVIFDKPSAPAAPGTGAPGTVAPGTGAPGTGATGLVSRARKHNRV